MTFNLSEIFYSIQGEGPFSGLPCIFVRSSGCNLRCEWGKNRCDTPFTSWEAERNLVELSDLVRLIEECAPDCREVILTGGEPLLQTDLKKLCRELKTRGYRLHLETNGTAPLLEEIDIVVCSPKLKDSVPHGANARELHLKHHSRFLEYLNGSDSRLYLKFVIAENTDFDEVLQTIRTVGSPPDRVYLMPEGITAEQILNNSHRTWELAAKHQFRFSSRLHIMLWGNERGR